MVNSSTYSYLLLVRDAESGESHATFKNGVDLDRRFHFTELMASEFPPAEAQVLVDELLEEIQSRRDPNGIPFWGELELLSGETSGVSLSSRRELSAFLEEIFGNACCLGWAS